MNLWLSTPGPDTVACCGCGEKTEVTGASYCGVTMIAGAGTLDCEGPPRGTGDGLTWWEMENLLLCAIQLHETVMG